MDRPGLLKLHLTARYAASTLLLNLPFLHAVLAFMCCYAERTVLLL